MSTLTVHHLNSSQSERIPWLCEELAIPYELKTYERVSAGFAPSEYKALHLAGSAPIIQDGDLTLAESGACIEYIAHRYGGGALFIPPTHPVYPQFLYWWHWANSSLQPLLNLTGALSRSGVANDDPRSVVMKDRIDIALRMLDTRLKENDWLAGTEFTAADIMIVFSLTTMRYFYAYSLGEYGNVVRYLQRVGTRDGYQRAMRKCEPEMELVLGAEPPKNSFGITSKW
ncbi:Glutathione S-transferase [Mycena sanguinolenta]|uniref:Glutathione S-transferase n=1 Tax=Mycena sanguinolenta TaxID=230812 RepID=A0A8H6YWW5_9AGAR|nr:Glutathione S-transferase [Mycena sanguinolenta]